MLRIDNLQINHLEKPFGISPAPVRLTWTLSGTGRQVSYEAEILLDGKPVETSGVVKTSAMFWQSEKMLVYKKDYVVKLKVTDEADNSTESTEIAVTAGIGPDQPESVSLRNTCNKNKQRTAEISPFGIAILCWLSQSDIYCRNQQEGRDDI